MTAQLLHRKRAIIDYTNWRGERRERFIQPIELYFGKTEYHQVEQWFVIALDLAKGERRTFALADIHAWRTAARDVIEVPR